MLVIALQPALQFAAEPTTAEERTEAVRRARELEQYPFGEEALEQRALLFRWWREIPDLKLRWCDSLLLDLEIGSEELTGTIRIQALLSGGAFLIENPEAVDEPRRVWLAGIEGALRTYRRAVELRPDAKSEDLDELAELERAGRLGEYVDRHAAECD